MCFNRKVLIGLGVVALGVLALAPGALAWALPLLVFAACPLSMVFMMRAMSGGRSCRSEGDSSPERTQGVDDELVRLRAEIDQLRAERAASGDAGRGPAAVASPPGSPPAA
ncbi:MAG: DUF2933 domain-containing protein [Actinomycetota bacterium]|nr:DUF2933 domain-containing protein [Actinomycetota bacterium]